MERTSGPARRDASRRLDDEPPADAGAVARMHDMEIVEQRAPLVVCVESGVREPDEPGALFGEDGDSLERRVRESLGPHGETVGLYVTVQIGVGVRTAVVPAPAVGVQGRDRRCIACQGWAALDHVD